MATSISATGFQGNLSSSFHGSWGSSIVGEDYSMLAKSVKTHSESCEAKQGTTHDEERNHEFCKSIGADAKQRQGLIRLAKKKNGESWGSLHDTSDASLHFVLSPLEI
ncbi:hypothetical protein M0R45_000118 [Rubus argutus]|uniref:Uncharacterized protein n=1 Tax=Rubus argutus TaxID=59490 RepID=A0AAW1VQQ3_RUBAR